MDLDKYKFRYDAYKNNTFDLDVVEKSINDSKLSSYHYLRQFQLESTGYRRFDFNMQDIYRTNKVNHVYTLTPRKWLFYIDHEFINVGKRLSYKRSKLYEKELSFTDIMNRPDLFDSSFLMFINGTLYLRGINILCKEDKTYMVINCKEQPSPEGITISDMRNFIDNNAKVTIFFIPNIGIKNLHTNAYRLRTLNKSTGVPNNLLNLSENVDYNNALTFMNHVNDVKSIPVISEMSDSGLYVSNDVVNNIINTNPNNTGLDITLIPLRNLLTRVRIDKGNKWFELPMQDYPVAVENCLVTDISGNFIHDARIKHYYPNIYSIENVDNIISRTELLVYVFYLNNGYNQLKHLDMLAAYHKYVPDYLARYKEGTINPIVKDFDPTIVNYNIKDYHNSVEYDDHFKYKIAKMKEYIKADPNNFKRYLKNLGLGNNYYYVDVSKINLDSRKRKDNHDTKLDLYEFKEEMYMFVFRNDFRGMYDELIIHVDGTRYQEKIMVFRTDMLDYVYIPTYLVKNNSMIEIEKVTDVKKEYPFKSSSLSTIHTIDIGEFAVRNKTLYNDLFVIDKATGRYLDSEDYQVILPVKFHLDDMDSDIVLDYIIVESSNGYYQLALLDHGLIELQEDMEPENTDNAYYLTVQNNDNEFYQFDVQNKKALFGKVDYLNGCITNKLRSLEDKKLIYQFKMVDGSVKIEISEDDGASKTLAEGGLNLIDLDDVFLPCPREIKIKLLDEKYLNRDLALHIKKNHNYEVVEDDLLYEEIIIYDHEGVSYKVSVLRDYMLAYYRDYECKEIYLKEEGNIFKLSIVGNKLIVDLVENVEEIIDRISYISDYINVRDGLNGKVYRIFINNGNLEAEISDNEEVFEQDLHIEGDNKHHYVLLTYNGLIRITPINYNRDPELDFYSIIFKTVSKNDSRYFRVYHNGRLIPRHVSSVVFPNYCDFTDAELRLGFKKQQGVHYNIAIECMPYMMKQVCYLNSIPTDKVINLKGLIDKPFDFKWYDIYLNGKKLTTKDVEIVSAHLIKVLKTDSVKGLEIIENSRDKEYFGGFDVIYDIIDELFENDKVFSDNLNNSVKENCDIKDNEIPTAGIEDVLIGSLDYILHHLYEFLLLSFGMINPDHNQLTMSDLYKFEGLVDKDTPLMIGFDIYGENRLDDERIVLNINPDE